MNETEAAHRIADGLLASGVRRGGALLVHSSLKAMGHVPGGPETVVRGLMEALGPQGTLLMPALSYATVTADAPLFDLLRTPSCIGAIPEHFRRREGTRRSVSPTHSVCAVGPLAGELLGRHQLDNTPCGANSPFRLLRDAGGQVLFLGCGLRPNTSMHAVEELVEPPYLFGPTVQYTVVLADGAQRVLNCRRHGFAGWRQRYDRLAERLHRDELRMGKVLEATVHLLDCRAIWSRGEAALRANDFCFVERG